VLGHSSRACSKSKEEAKSVENAGSASVATKKNVKGSVFTRLSPSVDAPPVAAPPVEVPPVDAPKLDAPIIPTEACVA
jgi:hypothetical protein